MALSKHIDDLFDECLVPVLARVPFNDLVRHVPLTSQRWKSLLNLAIRERTSLRIYNKEYHHLKCNQTNYYFIDTGRVSADDYAKYLSCLLNQSDDHQLYAPCDHYMRSTLRAPLCTTICDTFRNLEHFALVGVGICPKALFRLLEHFQKTLKSLFLKHVETSEFPWDCAVHRIEYRLAILSVINSMTSLRQLALSQGYFPCIDEPLSAVLFRLEELHLADYCFKIAGLSKVDETKLRQLTLENVTLNYGDLSTLVREKPGLCQLTHLNVDVYSILDVDNFFGDSTLETVVKVFPWLEHLGVRLTEGIIDDYDTLHKMIPVISQLKSLSSLQVTTQWDLWKTNFSCALTNDQQIEYRIESLQVLRLETYLHIDSLAVLRGLYPNLQQLYLDAVQFQCTCFEDEPTFFTLPSLRSTECTCKVRIAKHLDSFEYLPKISLN